MEFRAFPELSQLRRCEKSAFCAPGSQIFGSKLTYFTLLHHAIFAEQHGEGQSALQIAQRAGQAQTAFHRQRHRETQGCATQEALHGLRLVHGQANEDRKSTRLNSSHSQISYAVFCLKKKKKRKT